jgi:hypothetical protein
MWTRHCTLVASRMADDDADNDDDDTDAAHVVKKRP